MPFAIVRNDITQMAADVIVNTANPRPVIGLGTDSRIHEAAGHGLLEARQRIGSIEPGCAAITPAFGLNAKYVIHTVGPVWQGGAWGEERLLRSCYTNSLQLALEHGCSSIAFPLISTGNYGFPKDRALQIAISVFSAFLLEQEMQIWLVVYDRDSYRLSEKLFRGVASYIDENYVSAWDPAERLERKTLDYPSQSVALRREDPKKQPVRPSMPMPMAAPRAAPPAAAVGSGSLADMLERMDAGFSETLLKLIDQSGKKDSEVYKRANISKQHFSKIRNNPNYRPTKPTAVAFAVALELDLEQTRDLIGRAGYALTNSSKFDLIVRYFIERRNYNVVEINVALYEFDQSLLGG